ncbi:MAG: hypothetical protein LBB68_05015 [Treponema sp.]|jgi:hypothetical protein|nr:hypothetical protein [Treponema sp.]
MKITRSALLKITAGLGGALIVYAFLRQFTGITVDEALEKFILDGVIFAALGLFIYNRKLVSDEKKAKEREEAEAAGEEKG